MEGTSINMTESYFDLREVSDPYYGEETGGGGGGPDWLLIILILLILGGIGAFLYMKRKTFFSKMASMKKAEQVEVKSDD